MKTMRKEQIVKKMKDLLNEDPVKFSALLSAIMKDILHGCSVIDSEETKK